MLLHLNDPTISTTDSSFHDGCFLCCVMHLALEFFVFKVLMKVLVFVALKILRRRAPWLFSKRSDVVRRDSCSVVTNSTSCSAFSCIPRMCCPKRRNRFRQCERQRKQRVCSLCPLNRLSTWVHEVLLPPPLPLHKSSAQVAEVGQTESASSHPEGLNATADKQATKDLPMPNQPKTHLMDLTRLQQWDAILRKPKLKRREAKYRDPEGLYPLHWAAAGPAPHAVLARLLDVYPSAARRKDTEGSLPLHFAAHYGASRESMALLRAAHPAAAQQQDVYGRTPLYHATDKRASLEVLQLLGQDDPSVILTPCFTRTEASPREQAVRTPLYLMWAAVLQGRRQNGKQWDKAVWMLRTSYTYHCNCRSITEDEKEETSLLTACISMDLYLPTPTVSTVLQQYPDTRSLLCPMVTAASTHSYSLARAKYILELLHSATKSSRKTEGGALDLSAVVVAAVRSGQPWPILQIVLPWIMNAASTIPPLVALAAMAQPLRYTADTPSLPPVWDPLALRRKQTKEAAHVVNESTVREEQPEPEQLHEEEDYHLETIYQLLRRDPTQIQHTANLQS